MKKAGSGGFAIENAPMACALAHPKGFGARSIVEIYRERGPEIFSRSVRHRVATLDGYAGPKYPMDGLRRVMEEYLGDVKLGYAATDVMVHTYDTASRRPVFFKSWKEKWMGLPMADAATGTAAAPTYFPPYAVDGMVLIDGGIFGVNPAMFAVTEGLQRWDGEDLAVLSLGTGASERPITYEAARAFGPVGWMRQGDLLGCAFDGQSETAHHQALEQPHCRYLRVQVEGAIGAMDDASRANTGRLVGLAEEMIRKNESELNGLVQLLM